MKKTLIIGLFTGSMAVASFGQGVISGNYTSSGAIGSPITYANVNVPVGSAGLAIGSGFSAQLLYFNGSAFVAVPNSIAPFLATDGDTANGAGYSAGIGVTIPGWVSGPVTLEWTAFNTVQIGSYSAGQITGSSSPFTMTPVDQGLPVYPDFSSGTGYSAFTVSAAPVPEPSTLALAGLGGFGMLMALRRKKA